ncbi:MAG: UDP-4-amino-4,6-dideoxy-N-acetyl-beta-L-altrosamine N-acetyltransferase [Lachnospiraceae bacterium]|nr:UDP-4-amino-4,6-dideoxy-N-acetyl-beta-L-altrosamine N-acetyltransferase [Lachnospiraceae bacterium]
MIESARLMFRPITVEDTDMVLKWRNSEHVKNNFIVRRDISKEEHLNWLKTKVFAEIVMQFIIIEKDSGIPIGSVYFRDIDRTARKAEYGIFIGEESAKGKGYGKETAERMVKYFFDEMKFHKLSLRVLEKNQAAIRSYENAGFKIEGRLVDELYFNGVYETVLFMAIIEKNTKK